MDLSLSIEEVSEKLKIRKQYLIAMEEGRWEDIPGKAYRDGYLKMYCKFLKISLDASAPDEEAKIEKPKSIKSMDNVKLVLALTLVLTISFCYLIYNKLNTESDVTVHLENIDHKDYLTNSSNTKLK